MFKTLIAAIMSIVTLLTSVPTQVFFNEESNNYSVETSDYSIEGKTSMGGIMADALNEYNTNTSEYQDYYISEVEEKDGDIIVETNALTSCSVTVEIIDEQTNTIVSSYEEKVPDGEASVTVEIDDDIPQYYVVKASLANENEEQISDTFVDEDNTEWYEEFQNTTTDDFEGYDIISLDGDKTNNFAVFNEDVVVFDNSVELVSSNEQKNKYTFSNSSDVTELKEGQIFAYNTDKVNEMVVGKVTDIDEGRKETTVTIEETALEETFCFVKISCEIEEAFDGKHDSPDGEQMLETCSNDNVEASKEYSKTWSFSKGAISGSVTMRASVAFSLEYSVWDRYASASLSISPEASVHADVSYKTGRKVIPVASPSVWVYGIELKFSVKIVYEVSAKISFDASISAKFGFSWNTSSKKAQNIGKRPVVTARVNIEGHFYLGLQLIPSVSPLGIATLSLTGEAGAQLNASAGWNYSSEQTEKHDCGILCIAGDIDIKVQISAALEIEVLGWKIVDANWNIWSRTFDNVLIFHYSIKYNEFGWDECQHYSHLLTFKVVNSAGKAIKNASVDGSKTNDNGTVKLWYSDGKHNIAVKASGYQTKNYSFASDEPKTFKIVLAEGNSDSITYETDSSYSTYTRKKSSKTSGNGNSTYIAPLTYSEPAEGVVLSTALSGQRRSDVAWVQRELKKLGYSVSVDGYYGNSTANVVKQFQGDYGLPVTGKVNANTLALIKKPLKLPAAPILRLTTSSEIASGEIVSVAWDAVNYAESYNIYVYNQNGILVDNEIDTKATAAAFVLYESGTYTVKAETKNSRGTSEQSVLGTVIKVLNKATVTFVDWDGTVLSKQFVDYGKGAVTPASPERDGHTFVRWDNSYSKVLGEDIVVNAVYSKNQFTVKFLNTDGTLLSAEKCYFEDAANAPSVDMIKIPAGYSFIGWNKDFSSVIEDITVKPVLGWVNDNLPIIIDNYSVVEDAGNGYNVSVTLRNYEKQRTNGRVVVALKTASERFVTMTESSAFTLAKSNVSSNFISTTSLDIFVPCSEKITYIDIFVVDTYEALIPISEVKRCTVNEGTSDEPIFEMKGFVEPELAGKQATLFIYKIGDAADYTNEFIGQTVIANDGSYTFKYNLREEPSIKTGDFYVALGIEGSDGAIFIDKIEAPKPIYTVTIKDFDGSIISTQRVEQGGYATLPEENPERTGYIFAGWDYTNTSVNEDITITAIYVHRTYTVVFIDWTNKRFDVHTYYYGEPLVTPDLNSLDEYDTIGWEGAVEGTPVTENMVISAKYDKKTFTVNFYDIEGNIISTQEVEYGESAKIPEAETDSNLEYYVWDKSEASYVTSDIEVHPYYKFKEDTAKPEFSLKSGVYGDTVLLIIACQTENAIMYYSVNGSDFVEYTSPVEIDETAEVLCYASSFGRNDSEYNSGYYIINREGSDNWKFPVTVIDNGEVIATYILNKGQNINSETVPVNKEGHTLCGFYLDETFSTSVDGDFEISNETTVYIKLEKNSYNVTFKDVDGNVIKEQTVAYLEAAIPPDNVEVPDGYIFVGWNKDDYYCVTEDVEIIAVMQDEKSYAKIELNRTTYTMMEGYSYTLEAKVQNDGEYEIIWKSDDESVATVDQSGRVLAVSDGVAVITASIVGKNAYALCYITVTENPVQSIKLNEDSILANDNGVIYGISPFANTVSEIQSQIESENIRFFLDEEELSSLARVSTGTVVRLYDENGNLLDEKVISVIGDVDGTGTMGVADASRITRYLVGKEEMSQAVLLSADVNSDGVVNNKDASLIMRVLVGKETV